MKGLLLLGAATSVAVAQFCEHQWEGSFARNASKRRVRPDVAPPPLDIQPLIINGPSSNRIDLIFFGDGCMSRLRNNTRLCIHLLT